MARSVGDRRGWREEEAYAQSELNTSRLLVGFIVKFGKSSSV